MPGTPSLLLPYDRLKTAETPFRTARVPAVEPLTLANPGGIGWNERIAVAVASAAALFYRYSGQSVIPISLRLRSRDGTNTCAIMIPVSGSMPTAELLAAAGAALAAPTLPVDPNAPLFLDIRSPDEHDRGAQSEGASSDIRADVCVVYDFFSDSVETSIVYNASLFTHMTSARLLRHLNATMSSLRTDPATSVAAIDVFSSEEHAWFEAHCNAVPLNFDESLVHEEIARRALQNPDGLAVRFNDEHLSYGQLNRRANQLARYFLHHGVPCEGRILVCLEPSLEVPVTLLAILKAGATYVPVNPAHPEFRIRMIVEDTAPKLIVTHAQTRNIVSGLGIELLDVGDPPSEIAGQLTDDPDVEIRRDQVAYIFYTSGTTGQPKGVAASHGNMIHFINVARSRYKISSSDVIPAVASFTFSISMFELMSPLSAGGTLIILERQHVLDAARMTATLQQVTLFHIGPSLLKNIVRFIKQNVADYGAFAAVRHASSGGDMVPAELLRDLQQIFSSSELYVIYGCSEISLMGCTWELPRSPVSRTYVGKPFSNVRLLVLDDDGNQVPIGATGDVCFGGPGVANGYVNGLVPTGAAFFVRDGVRYYRTGDRGRLNGNGELELLGRRDFQIKVRGMRVELAEIDYHLRQAKGVRDGLVAVKTSSRGQPVLVAYYVADGEKACGETVSHEELRAHMAARLPDYMVPVFYVVMDALPLNYNLKVDRKALPELAPAGTAVKNPPVTESQVAIARIWSALLHTDGVGLDDNFMLLGGDSLLAMEMIYLVQQQLGYRLDGMDVLRESLLILANLVDGASGKTAVGEAQSAGREILPVSSFYFGADNSLYGLYNPAAGEARSLPVLICPPIGYEYMRCHFLLRTLAEKLAETGVPSLRFDFFGSGDSLGSGADGSLARWRNDLLVAFDELKRRAGTDRVRVFCLRLTTTLALQSLPSGNVDRWVCWDPVVDGSSYYRELKRMNGEKVQKLLVKRNLKRPRRIAGSEELVGTRFSDESLQEMKALLLRDEDLADEMDIRQVLSGDFAAADTGNSVLDRCSGKARVELGSESFWYRSTRVTMAITNREILDSVHAHLLADER
jgi:amino acid adenylation domain-containing protein